MPFQLPVSKDTETINSPLLIVERAWFEIQWHQYKAGENSWKSNWIQNFFYNTFWMYVIILPNIGIIKTQLLGENLTTEKKISVLEEFILKNLMFLICVHFLLLLLY